MEEERERDVLSRRIIGAAISVHRVLGPGLLESVYEACLAEELKRRGVPSLTQVKLPVTYKGLEVREAFRIDILVADSIVVEVKAVAALKPVHRAQLLTYLRLSGHHLGLLLNFQETRLVDGIRRLVNGFPKRPGAAA